MLHGPGTTHRAEIDEASGDIAERRRAVEECVVAPVLAEASAAASDGCQLLVNPTGRFLTGGPKGDTGLTGRKIIVDIYGGAAPHSGGAFSGKDPPKVDRSATYMARFLAKQVVGRGWAQRCLIQLAYAIGVVEPVSAAVDTFGTAAIAEDDIAKRLQEEFSLTPGAIIATLDLQRCRPGMAVRQVGRNPTLENRGPARVNFPAPPRKAIPRPQPAVHRFHQAAI